MPPKYETLSEPELQALVLEVLRKSEKPLHAVDVSKQLPRLYRVQASQVADLLLRLHHAGEIYSWGASRQRELFAVDSPQQRARQGILDTLHDPLSLVQLKAKIARHLRGCPPKDIANVVAQALKQLVQEDLVVRHPKAGERYGLPKQLHSIEEALQNLRNQFPEMGTDDISQAVLRAFAPSNSLEERIQQAILSAEPRANQGALASIPQVRRHLHPAVSKQQFDSALLNLGRQGVLSIHVFYGHAQISEQERDELVFDQKENYYGGVTFRSH